MDYYRQKRVERLQKYIGEQGLDAMLITSKDAVFYLSGASYDPVERPFIIILRPEGVPSLVVPRLEYEHMMKVEGFGEIHWYFEYPSIDGQNWYDYVNKDIGKGAVIGIEPSMPSVYRECLKAKKTVIVDYIDTMRLVKDESEINAIRLACKWTDYGMKMLHEGLYRGESVIEATMHARNIQTGVVKTTDFNYMTSSFLTAAWPAPKSAQPHSLPDLGSRMGDGPIVLMSFNRVNGYASENERTVFLGEPSDRDRRLFDQMMKAREIALSMVKPGTRCADIDLATQDYFKSLGYEDAIRHRTGHGIGLGNHEAPFLSAGGDHVLEENMVISIEPALYFDDIGGFRHSDTVLVTKTGYEIMTHYPVDLDSLTVKENRRFKKAKGAIIRKFINIK
ncbi:MAG: aminopeptidase P family protein [Oscillospiraceae bacterium]|jgi:Xaa-Pro aminopeptidase|nr:aminopeptidase P family protein [Acidaminococcaceae bacterium]MBQ1779763.1 aminopeptidase P family protein [Acidaminococcaceae bacterium]MBQ1790144.1 aminopeptidase P family protein [Oscillospiraceae bacterium]